MSGGESPTLGYFEISNSEYTKFERSFEISLNNTELLSEYPGHTIAAQQSRGYMPGFSPCPNIRLVRSFDPARIGKCMVHEFPDVVFGLAASGCQYLVL